MMIEAEVMENEVVEYKKTKLSTVSPQDVKGLLDFKVSEYREKGMLVEPSLCNYIAIGFDEIDSEIARVEAYEKQFKELKTRLKEFKKERLKETAEYIEDMGVDKLKGDLVSSISVKKESVSITKKFVIDEDKDELERKGYGHYEENIREIPKTIRINKRR